MLHHEKCFVSLPKCCSNIDFKTYTKKYHLRRTTVYSENNPSSNMLTLHRICTMAICFPHTYTLTSPHTRKEQNHKNNKCCIGLYITSLQFPYIFVGS